MDTHTHGFALPAARSALSFSSQLTSNEGNSTITTNGARLSAITAATSSVQHLKREQMHG